jgi:predicted PurR-regulated permease PerM
MDTMDYAMQAASLIALLLFIVMMICLIPTIFFIRHQITKLVTSTKKLETELQAIAQDSRQLVNNINALTTKINQQVDTVCAVVDTARQWSAMANRVVTGVGSLIEPPLTGLARHAGLFRMGLNVFMHALRAKHHNKSNQPQEDKNV